MEKELKVIVDIPTVLSTTEPDVNGRIYHRETFERVLKSKGYMWPSTATDKVEKDPERPIRIRFFDDVDFYQYVLITEGWGCPREYINDEHHLNTLVTNDEILEAEFVFIQSRYHILIPMKKSTYEKAADFLSKCKGYAILWDMFISEDGLRVGVNDILYLDIFPGEISIPKLVMPILQ